MLRKLFSFLPALAVCTLLVFTLNAAIILAEKSGLVCCETLLGDAHTDEITPSPTHGDVCDCAQHLHSLIAPGGPFLAVMEAPLSEPTFAPFLSRDPGSFTREINQPPRLS